MQTQSLIGGSLLVRSNSPLIYKIAESFHIFISLRMFTQMIDAIILPFCTDGKLLVRGLLLLYNNRVYNHDNNIECNYFAVSNIVHIRNIRANKHGRFAVSCRVCARCSFPFPLSFCQTHGEAITPDSRIVKINTSSAKLIDIKGISRTTVYRNEVSD